MDFGVVASEFLRALRGSRSQVAFSRRLGFASNVAAEWESGRRIPRVSTAVGAAARVGVDVPAALARFWPPLADILTGSGLAPWLDALRGEETVVTLAKRAGLSRQQCARMLSGRTEPRLHQFFALVHASTGRLSDLVAACVAIDQVNSLRHYHARVESSRHLAFDEPWSSPLLSALECLPSLERAEAEQSLARMFGLPRARVRRCLSHMVKAGLVARRAGGYVLSEPMLVDTGMATLAARRLAAHWARVATGRAESPAPSDLFSFNVFSVSHADLERIRQLQREHFQRVRAIIATSKPEAVAVINLQLVTFPAAE